MLLTVQWYIAGVCQWSSREATEKLQNNWDANSEALLGFEPRISCLLDRHFDQLSHSAYQSCWKSWINYVVPVYRKALLSFSCRKARLLWLNSLRRNPNTMHHQGLTQHVVETPRVLLTRVWPRSSQETVEKHQTSWNSNSKALLGFEPRVSCLQDRRFDQLSHGASEHLSNLGHMIDHISNMRLFEERFVAKKWPYKISFPGHNKGVKDLIC